MPCPLFSWLFFQSLSLSLLVLCSYVWRVRACMCVCYCTGLAVWAAGAQNEFKLDCMLCLDSWAQISGTSRILAFPFASNRQFMQHPSATYSTSKINMKVHEEPGVVSATLTTRIRIVLPLLKPYQATCGTIVCHFYCSNITAIITCHKVIGCSQGLVKCSGFVLSYVHEQHICCLMTWV